MAPVSKPRTGQPIADSNNARFYVKVHRQGRPPNPWIWAIYEEDHLCARKIATNSYSSADEAWQAGCVMLLRLHKNSVL